MCLWGGFFCWVEKTKKVKTVVDGSYTNPTKKKK